MDSQTKFGPVACSGIEPPQEPRVHICRLGQRSRTGEPIRTGRLPATAEQPKGLSVLGDVEVENVPTVVADDEEAVDHTERDRRNREEVHRGYRFAMIANETVPHVDPLQRRKPHPTRLRHKHHL
jgi:hypothetical protein